MNNASPSKIPLVAEHVLNELEGRVANTECKQLTDEDLLCLYSIFGPVLQRALDILEKQTTLAEYKTSKSRSLIEIKGENDRCYRVFPRINYCPCQAFKHQVLERKSEVLCKHVLAARIAQILGKTVCQDVTADQYCMLVRSMFDLE